MWYHGSKSDFSAEVSSLIPHEHRWQRLQVTFIPCAKAFARNIRLTREIAERSIMHGACIKLQKLSAFSTMTANWCVLSQHPLCIYLRLQTWNLLHFLCQFQFINVLGPVNLQLDVTWYQLIAGAWQCLFSLCGCDCNFRLEAAWPWCFVRIWWW